MDDFDFNSTDGNNNSPRKAPGKVLFYSLPSLFASSQTSLLMTSRSGTNLIRILEARVKASVASQ